MAYRLSAQARQGLREIGLYVGSVWGPATRRAVLARVMSSIEIVGRHLLLGRVRDDDLGSGRRSLASGQCIIIYTFKRRTATILRIIDGRRDYPMLVRNA